MDPCFHVKEIQSILKTLHRLLQTFARNLNDTHRENCVLLNSIQEFIEIETRLLLTFVLCLHNQLVSIHSIAAY